MVVCPTCRDASKQVLRENSYFPFCSKRCRDRDLGAWMNEEYRFAAEPSITEGPADENPSS